MTLNEIKRGESCVMVDLTASGALGQRLMDLGFFPGAKIKVVRNAPLVDPVEIELDATLLTIRHEEAAHILVTKNA